MSACNTGLKPKKKYYFYRFQTSEENSNKNRGVYYDKPMRWVFRNTCWFHLILLATLVGAGWKLRFQTIRMYIYHDTIKIKIFLVFFSKIWIHTRLTKLKTKHAVCDTSIHLCEIGQKRLLALFLCHSCIPWSFVICSAFTFSRWAMVPLIVTWMKMSWEYILGRRRKKRTGKRYSRIDSSLNSFYLQSLIYHIDAYDTWFYTKQ